MFYCFLIDANEILKYIDHVNIMFSAIWKLKIWWKYYSFVP